MKLKNCILFIIPILALWLPAQSQDPGYTVPKIEDLVKIPPSPEAQAFAKYGNTAVNLYTGTPDINIPLGTLQGREISIPVTLTYDASGIKVDQIATWAGLGWNLNLGGMITRQVRGNPDDYFTSMPTYYPFYAESVWSDYQLVNAISTGEFQSHPPGELARYFNFMDRALKSPENGGNIEFQPDVYSFSALGLSGTIFINYTTNLGYCMEHPEIKVVPFFQSSSNPLSKIITGWQILDATGNVYYFDVAEVTTINENNSYDGSRVYNSAWALTKVESKNKRDLIEFSYGSVAWEEPKLAGRSDYRVDIVSNSSPCGSDQLVLPTVSSPTYTITQLELSSIQLNGATVLQISGKPRSDLAGKGAIDAITIRDQNGNQLDHYKFLHSYFGPLSATTENEMRLKLDAIEIHGAVVSSDPQSYQFEYFDPLTLPSRESFAQDFWGYFNGKNSNTTLIPYNYLFDKANEVNFNWKGGSRRPSFTHARTGTLQFMKYPTGGVTEITYQAHRTAEIATITAEVEYVTNFGMVGGTTQNNPYNYYIDQACPNPGFPAGISGTFNVPIGGKHEIRISASTIGNYVPGFQYAAIYRTGPVDCDTNGNCNFGTPQDFCDLFGTSLPWSYSGSLARNMTIMHYLENLESGAYRFLMLNCDPYVTLNVEISSVPEISSHEVGGLRVSSFIDRDEYGNTQSSRYLFYGDLSSVPNLAISDSLVTNSNLETGVLHAPVEFEKAMLSEQFDHSGSGVPPELTCWRTTRYSSNRSHADQHVTYPIVSEVAFDSDGKFNGFTVSEFLGGINMYKEGYSKATILSGKISRKRIFRNDGQVLADEQNYYSQRSDGQGINGFAFVFQNNSILDTYVKSVISTPNDEFYMFEPPIFVFQNSEGGGSNQEQHCQRGGYIYHLFGYSDPFTKLVARSQAEAFCNQQGIPHSEIVDDTYFDQYYVRKLTYNILLCKNLGGAVNKIIYLFPRHWVTTDSTRQINFTSTGTIETVTKNYYENTNHFQVTRVEHKDSKGVLRKMKLYYPDEMSVAEPANSIWPTLITQNRISQVAKKEATYGSNQPGFVQKSIFKTITTGSTTMIVPDKEQFSSGAGALEDRIQYHSYDNMGNPTEVSKVSDSRNSYLWGYDKMYPVAHAKNALVKDIFYTSFEEEEGGNSSLGDSRTGNKSKTDGYSKSLTGLTASIPYVLTYWQKSDTVWSLQTANIAASDSTTYNISLSGQVDEVRFCPQATQMTTYTYKLGRGVSSVMDPNNQVTTYEYDEMGRLWLIRDFNGNILKQYKYHYRSGPIESPTGTQY